MTRSSITNIEPYTTLTSVIHLRKNVSGIVDDAVRRWRKHMCDEIAPFKQGEKLRQGRHRLSHMDHDRQIERRGRLLSTPQDLEIILARHVSGKPCFDPADDVAILRDRFASRGDVCAA